MNNTSHTLGVLDVSGALLIEALGLPSNTEIRGAQMALSRPDVVQLLISHPDLPESERGALIPHVSAEMQTDTAIVRPAPKFVRWIL